ncbi:MAG TPA: MBL fold metallo-hydrolase [Candidatus Binatia bacterium]|jgi:glyoxylase-like metal-dependent hydrolase (beta-lactamase superfamily II)|nr:MBL fold metallo-hydrolase [Candidatus Binatia bacterium]
MKQPVWFKQLELGPMQNYVYLLGDPNTHEAAVVDAAWDIDAIVDTAEADGYRITSNLVTHFHPDHLGGNLMGHSIVGAAELAARVPAKTIIHKDELPFVHRISGLSASDVVGVEGGDEHMVGTLKVKLVHTPGHTPGSQCFLVGNALVSGDTLFIGSCGRVDLPGSNPEDMYRSLHHVLGVMPDDTILFPGHNYAPRSRSTLGDEKRTNMMMRFQNLDDFLAVMSPLRS